MRLRVEERAVPDAEQAEQQRHVLLRRRGAEVLVDQVEAVQHLAELLRADRDHQREADRGVVRVAAADPVPELEHVGHVDAEVRHALGVGGQCDEVLGHRVGVRAQLGEQPVPRRGGVGDGLDGGEGLRGDDEQRLGGVQVADGLVQVGAVHVGDEADVQVAGGVGAQHLVRHRRAQVGAADADVDDGADPPAGVALPLAGADLVGEGAHLVEHGVHGRHHVLAVHLDDGAARGAQRGVQDGAVLGGVDLVAAEHRVPQLGHAGGLGQLAQQAEGLVRHQLLGVVHVQVTDLQGVAAAALGVGGEQLAQVRLAEFRPVLPEGRPLRGAVQGGAALGGLRAGVQFGHRNAPRFIWVQIPAGPSGRVARGPAVRVVRRLR